MGGQALPFTAGEATESTSLFNTIGRMWRLGVDVTIAAAAIMSKAALATDTVEDFRNFISLGLRLVVYNNLVNLTY